MFAILAVGISTPANAGSGGALGGQPEIRGSYCDGSDEGVAPNRPGCARIKGYIAAGERFGSDDRIGGRPSRFAPINNGIAGAHSSTGVMIIGAPLGADRFMAPIGSGDIAR
jgi:hypothetical protein